MNKWRDGSGGRSTPSGNWGPLVVNDNREPCPWDIGDEHHIYPDYHRMRGYYQPPAPQPKRWYVSVAIVAVVVLMGVIYG